MSSPNVFIIESLELKDEIIGRYDGQILADILKLSGKSPYYCYVRTQHELENALKLFNKSEYRYLHLSCHGNKKGIATTLDYLEFNELSTLLSPYIEKRRLFVSACSTVNKNFAKELFLNTGCLSLIGPTVDISFTEAALAWATFYHLMFKNDNKKMIRDDILDTIEIIINTFNMPFAYYHKINDKPYYKREI